MTFAVGVTGGIGCGKSSAAHLFAELGATIIDTDDIAHRITRTDQAALTRIEQTFGHDYIKPDGTLDRNKMRQRVFSDPDARKQLENILHPLIRQQAAIELNNSRSEYTLIIVPLLLETASYKSMIQRILVVDCDEALQISRTMARSNLTRDEVQAIMDCQISRNQRLAKADDILENNQDIEHLKTRVFALHQKYLQLAHTH